MTASSIALKVSGLSHFEGSTQLLHSISFEARAGEVLGVLGPNGSGKSTLLQVISGLRGSGKEVCIGDTPLRNFTQQERAARIVYVGDDCTSEFSLTAEETVMIGRYALGGEGMNDSLHAQVDRVMEETGCAPYRHRYLDQLSGGERQRVALARALLQGAKILCLDESFSKLDVHHQVRMGSLLRRLASRGFAILLVSHDLNYTAQWADRLLLLRDGKKVDFGLTKEALNEGNLRALYPDAAFRLETAQGQTRVYFTSSDL